MRFRRAFCEFWQSLEWLLVVYTLYQYQSKSNQVCPCLACGSCLYVIVSDLKEKQHRLSSGSRAISLLVYSRETIYKVIRRYLFRLVHKTSTYQFPPNLRALWCKVNRVSLIFFPTRLLACLMVHFMSFVVLKSYFTVPLQAYVKRNQTVWLTLVNMISLLCFRLNGKKPLK